MKATDNPYIREQIWQVKTGNSRRNINTNSSQKMIYRTNYYNVLGTTEDISQTIHSQESSNLQLVYQ